MELARADSGVVGAPACRMLTAALFARKGRVTGRPCSSLPLWSINLRFSPKQSACLVGSGLVINLFVALLSTHAQYYRGEIGRSTEFERSKTGEYQCFQRTFQDFCILSNMLGLPQYPPIRLSD